jgi:hypothetical protein
MPHYKVLGFRSSEQNLETIIEKNMLQQNDVTKNCKIELPCDRSRFLFKYVDFSRKICDIHVYGLCKS